MKIISILPIYIWWHYIKAPIRIVVLTFYFAKSTLHFFSVLTMLKTLFSPWRRLSEGYGKKFDLLELATSLVVNSIMRIFGALVRITLIVIAIVITITLIVSGFILLIYWILMPAMIVFLFITGLGFLIFF